MDKTTLDAKDNKETIEIDIKEEQPNGVAAQSPASSSSSQRSTAADEPAAKLLKLADIAELPKVTSKHYRLNAAYETDEITAVLKKQWHSGSHSKDFKHAATNAEVFTQPFQICLLPDLLSDVSLTQRLVDEMIDKVHWSRKEMDLYEFDQSNDLSNLPHCHLLAGFLHLLRNKLRPWLEQITGLQLDYVSASCSMYNVGDYLLVHDDLLKDRQIAFIYYLSPWNVADWQECNGGCLEIFNSDEHGFPQFPVCRKITPRNNRFAFFKVGSRSFHQVGEVIDYEHPRLTINGWFHGASNDDIIADTLRPFNMPKFVAPKDISACSLDHLINDDYLVMAMRQSIQKRVEESSEICLQKFLKEDKFQLLQVQLLADDTLLWLRQGPANAQNYEILQTDTANGIVLELLQLFGSKHMFELLRDYTDLDLSGDKAVAPSVSIELQRWTHGNYTVLADGAISEEKTLDLIFYLNATTDAGVIAYLSAEQEEENAVDLTTSSTSDSEDDFVTSSTQYAAPAQNDAVLLTITPVNNALNIVYRCEGTTRFTKYISHKLPMKNGPVFILSCSYKE